jgi:hypothetical protein
MTASPNLCQRQAVRTQDDKLTARTFNVGQQQQTFVLHVLALYPVSGLQQQ